MNPMVDIALLSLVALCVIGLVLEWPRVRAALDELDELELAMIRKQLARKQLDERAGPRGGRR